MFGPHSAAEDGPNIDVDVVLESAEAGPSSSKNKRE